MVDWIIPTDQPAPEHMPVNVKIAPFRLEDFIVLVHERLGIHATIHHPYKLCDFKPAYGYLFEYLLKEYDFWGYGDLDLVYGKFSDHYSPEDFSTCDVLSNHRDFVTGHLCLLRNSSQMRELFMKGEAYRKVFASPDYQGFDEQRLRFPIMIKKNGSVLGKNRNHILHQVLFGFYHSRLLAAFKGFLKKASPLLHHSKDKNLKDFTGIVRRYCEEGTIKARFQTNHLSDLSLRKQGIREWSVEWNYGRLACKKGNIRTQDLLYFHFMMVKENKKFRVTPMSHPIYSFQITSEGIKLVTV